MDNKNISFVQLSSYSTPEVVENNKTHWVEWGDDNNYFQYLIDRYNGSPTNNAIITAYIDLVLGDGVDATDSARKPQDYVNLRTLFNTDELHKIVNDRYMLGQAAFQVIYNQDKSKIVEVYHMPVEKLRAGVVDKNGDITHYFYAYDWQKVKRVDQVERIPAFGFGKAGEKVEILYIKPYRSGSFYYSPVDYQGGLMYAELEEEIANFHLNNILNGMTPSMLINFNNGTPPEDDKQEIEAQIARKWTGTSNAGKIIVAFNDDSAKAATIEPVQLSDAHQQYEFLSRECIAKIMVAHRVPSPILFGIKDNTGLGNNAEELKTAFQLLENTVIRPIRNQVLAAINEIMRFNGYDLDLYFKTLTPIEFNEAEKAQTTEQREVETGVKMSAQHDHPHLPEDLDDEVFSELDALGEEVDLDEWELIDEAPVDYDSDDDTIKLITKLARVPSSNPNGKSEQDSDLFKVRYRYAPSAVKDTSRKFCKMMVSATKVYRKEDIIAAGDRAVNPGFGPLGSNTYSLWLYKGGKNCHHFWMRQIYRRRDNSKIGVNQAERDLLNLDPAERRENRIPVNDKKVATRPIDMPNKGAYRP